MRCSNQQTALETRVLAQAQTFTSRIWGKHHSEVPEEQDFSTTISRFPLGGAHVSMVDCTSPIHVVIDRGRKERCCLYHLMEGNMTIEMGGNYYHLEKGGSALVPAGMPYEFRASAVRCVMVETIQSRLEHAFESVTGAFTLAGPTIWNLPHPQALALSLLIEFVRNELSPARLPLATPSHLRGMEFSINSCIARGLSRRTGHEIGQGDMIGIRTKAQIADWVAERIHLPFDLSELAAYAGLTVRSLQRSFVKVFNCQPLAYLRELRLDAANRELRKSAGRMSVTQIAVSLHLDHLGRFATAYHRKFGELPSETMKRYRAATA